ncbi:MAG: glycosyltransferase family 1 protein [Chryseobacterium sp.]|nr:MAG: glycosyltransferase family 1 protein [Chryseobacterium sp.]
MEIILDCERMKYPYTGLFEYCHQLGRALLEIKSTSDQIDIYLQDKDRHYFPADTKFITQRSLHKFFFPKLPAKADIWHATHQTSWYIPPAGRKIKRVLTIHDLNFLYENKSEQKRAAWLKKHQRNIDLADQLVAISEFTKNDVLKHLQVNKPITVIYNGCNVNMFPEFNNPTYKPTHPFLFTIGTVNAKKNFHVLPCLIANKDLELIIAGKADGDYIQTIMLEAKKYGVEDRVKILGAVSNEDKYWFYKNCEAFVFPSIAEGFGIPVIEAMTFGKPVFLSTATCLPEIGAEHAWYFKNFDPDEMRRTFTEGMIQYQQEQPQQSIMAHAAKFNWINTAKAYLEVYRSLM